MTMRMEHQSLSLKMSSMQHYMPFIIMITNDNSALIIIVLNAPQIASIITISLEFQL